MALKILVDNFTVLLSNAVLTSYFEGCRFMPPSSKNPLSGGIDREMKKNMYLAFLKARQDLFETLFMFITPILCFFMLLFYEPLFPYNYIIFVVLIILVSLALFCEYMDHYSRMN